MNWVLIWEGQALWICKLYNSCRYIVLYQHLRRPSPNKTTCAMNMALSSARLATLALSITVINILTACGSGSGNASPADDRRPQPGLAISSMAPGLSLLAGYAGGAGTLDGTGTDARFSFPVNIAIDPADNLYVTDQMSTPSALVLRTVTPEGAVTTLSVTTTSRSNTIDRAGNRYIAVGNSIVKVAPDGTASTLAGAVDASGFADGPGIDARLTGNGKMVVDQAGNLYVSNTKRVCLDSVPSCAYAGGAIRKISPAGTVVTLAGWIGAGNEAALTDGHGTAARFTAPGGLALDDAGNLYVTDVDAIRKISPSGDVTTLPKDPSMGTAPALRDLAVGRDNQLYALGSDKLYKVAPSGQMTVFADFANIDFGPAQPSSYASPIGLVLDSTGNAFVASQSAVVYKITPAGVLSVFAGTPVLRGDKDGKGALALFQYAASTARDAGGNIYVVEETGSIRTVAPDGTTTTLGSSGPNAIATFVDETGAVTSIFQPRAIAVVPDGTVYISDFLTIRKLGTTGVLTTLAGSKGIFGDTDGVGANGTFSSIRSMVADNAGNLYVAEAHSVRKVTPAGAVTTLAGSSTGGYADGKGAAAHFRFPSGIALDKTGNLLVSDTDNATIRKLSPDGVVTTVAGSPSERGLVDGVGATARFNSPKEMATDEAGNAYVIDTGTVRKITPGGVVTTIAGNSRFTGTRLGALPGNFSRLAGITYLGSNVFAVSDGTSILKLAVP